MHETHQLGMSSRQRLAVALAAVLLMLHWAAPNVRPFDVPASSGGSGPVFSAGFAAAQRGTVPRALPRVHAFDAGLPKTSAGGWNAGSKFVALPEGIHIARPSDAIAVPPAISRLLRTPRPAHDFEARAPPSPAA